MRPPSSPRSLVAAFGLAAALAAGPLGGAEFRGRLNPVVEPGTRALSAVVPAPADLVAKLPTAPGPEDRVYGLGRPPTIKGKTFVLALVATAAGGKTLWLDRDGDGAFSAEERRSFPDGKKSVSLTLPWANGIYRDFPITFEWSDAPMRRAAAATEAEVATPPAPTLVTSLVYNFNILFSGSVDVAGQPLRVMFAPKPVDTAIDPANQRTSMDTNFNGRFEPELGEAVNAAGKIPVFRAGERYLAVKTADVATGELIVEERPAADYLRFDAAPGQMMPDFAFTTLEGEKRKLADYRGKFVLLDFWGTWCGPCIEEMKHLDPLYETYRARGFEIIGMNIERTAGRLTPAEYEAGIVKVRAFLAKAGHRWPHATQESIERLTIDVLQINAYPTCILIGPDGKILSREARGQVLTDLLAKHLP